MLLPVGHVVGFTGQRQRRCAPSSWGHACGETSSWKSLPWPPNFSQISSRMPSPLVSRMYCKRKTCGAHQMHVATQHAAKGWSRFLS